MSEEECPKCVVATAMGFILKICGESLSDKIDCKELTGQYLRGEINADQVVKKIKRAARNDPELMANLNEIDRIRKTRKIES
ncbi:MAG: hypothetical protein KKD44_26720 [Proteobacteria bacterium]|nr:hypothetical protein [Pseudomonadota bacterium]